MPDKTEETQANMTLRVTLLVVLILAVVLLLWYLLYVSPTFTQIFSLSGSGKKGSMASSFRFSGESFAMAGEELAVASTAGAQLIGSDGELIAAESVPMDCPAVSASPILSAFYDIGGTALCVITHNGESILMPQENRILSADVNREGYLTVITEYPDYKGQVKVYSPQLSPLFVLDCGSSGYPLCARVSPSRRLVVSCLTAEGSTVRFFALDSESTLATLELPRELVLDFDFLEDGTLSLVTEKALLFPAEDGTISAAVDFEGMSLADYCLTGSCAAVLLHQGRSGSSGLLRTVDSSGGEIGSLSVDRDIFSLSVLEREILVLYEDEMTLYDTDFSDDISYQRVENGDLALLCGRHKALLLGNYGAELIRFLR